MRSWLRRWFARHAHGEAEPALGPRPDVTFVLDAAVAPPGAGPYRQALVPDAALEGPDGLYRPQIAAEAYRLLKPLASSGTMVRWLAERAEAAEERVQVSAFALYSEGPDDCAFKQSLRESVYALRAFMRTAHPNVEGLLDFGFNGKASLWLVTEHVEGEPLRERLRRAHEGERCDPVATAALAALAAEGLFAVKFLRWGGLIPQAIVITPAGDVILVGLAAGLVRVERGLDRTAPEDDVWPYVPLEVLHSSRYDDRAYVFTLGVLLWELGVGRPSAPSLVGRDLARLPPVKYLSELLLRSFTPPTSLVPSYPPELEAIVLRATAREPGDRFSSLGEFAQALRAFVEGHEPEGARAYLSRRGLG